MVVEVFHPCGPLLSAAPEVGANQGPPEGRVPFRVVRLERAPARVYCLLREAGVVWFEPLEVGRKPPVARPVGDELV